MDWVASAKDSYKFWKNISERLHLMRPDAEFKHLFFICLSSSSWNFSPNFNIYRQVEQLFLFHLLISETKSNKVLGKEGLALYNIIFNQL